MKPVPGAQHPPSARREGHRHDRHAGEARRIDDARAGVHRRTARPVWRDADAIARRQLLEHDTQRGHSAAPGRAGNRVDPEIRHCIGDDPPVAMRRDQHVHRRKALPRHRDHQQPAMPKGENKGPPLLAQPQRDVAAFDTPAVCPVDEPDVELNDPAQEAPQTFAAEEMAAPAARRLHVCAIPPRRPPQPLPADRARRRTGFHRGARKDRCGKGAGRAARSRRCGRDPIHRSDRRR